MTQERELPAGEPEQDAGPTAQNYEDAIRSCEHAYRKNKQRMFVLSILRETIDRFRTGKLYPHDEDFRK